MDCKHDQPPPYTVQTGPMPGTCYQGGAPQNAYPPQGIPEHGYPAQPGYPPQSGYPSQPGYPPQQPYYPQGTQVTVQPVATQVVVVGGCPSCRVGVLEDDFTCCGILCAILFFPIGLICCFAMKQRRCPNCGAIFG